MAGEYTWNDRERGEIWYNDRFDTIEECVQDAIEQEKKPGEKIVIGFCEDYIPFVDADVLLERASEDAQEELGEVAEDWPRFTCGRYKDADKLQAKLDKAFNEWLEETGQIPGFYRVVSLEDIVIIPEKEVKQ